MTSDINGTVVAIQGNAVQAGVLDSTEDGYVFTWNSATDEWEAKLAPTLQSQTFTSSGTWTCPSGVNYVILNGFGGGGGGASGSGSTGGGGGGASLPFTFVATVVPGTEYTVNIGAGGTSGGQGAHSNFGDGSDAIVWTGANAGNGSNGGASVATSDSSSLRFPSYGGHGGSLHTNGYNGAIAAFYLNLNDSVGQGGTSDASSGGGGGGGGLGAGSGSAGNGGNGSNTGAAGNGTDAAANTGAGGGGGGGTVSGTVGSGGTGGSGQITVSWVK